ncbi:MAG: PAS domain-containing protein [Parafilimonas sp.]|nr:PAS domain-containing protein [Parafilimonas sp.]
MQTREELLAKIEELENKLHESEQLVEAIKTGEVDAFALKTGNQSEIYTLQSGDYAYRILVEKFGEGAVNLTEDELIVYTNTYFFELLHLPYEKVVGCYFKEFVNSDSHESFSILFKQALHNGSSKGEINLCIDKKIIPVYISLTSLQPKLSTVGMIITDLSEKKKNEEIILKYQHDLELKNLQLLQTNTELDSFTYIASHDLQEPLRKIKTFINRIIETHNETLSENTNEYFKRILSASDRMQNLISALLDYSRTNITKNALVKTPLNDIVYQVKSDLQELLEENKAVIETGELPVLNIVPLHFNQLFSNLIINAVKYRKPRVSPKVTITSTVVEATEVFGAKSLQHNKYYKISVADNGIGFEQKYAGKIFELFQRLHSRFEYEGTGIGLAICKKIVQNHNGIIQAYGEPNAGATFFIYLPVA